MTATRTIEVMAGGTKVQIDVVVTRKVIRTERVWADGTEVECKVYKLQQGREIIASVDGKEIDRAYMGNIQHVRSKLPGVVAVIHNKVGLKQGTVDQIEAAIKAATDEAEADPEVAEYRQMEAKARKIDQEHAEHVADVEDMMTLGGHTY